MGLLFDEEKYNFTHIKQVKYNYNGFEVVVSLYEYDQYSRTLFFSETEKYESVSVVARRESNEKYISYEKEYDAVFQSFVSWKQNEGPSVSIEFQIQKIIDEAEQELDYLKGRTDEFVTHVNTIRSH